MVSVSFTALPPALTTELAQHRPSKLSAECKDEYLPLCCDRAPSLLSPGVLSGRDRGDHLSGFRESLWRRERHRGRLATGGCGIPRKSLPGLAQSWPLSSLASRQRSGVPGPEAGAGRSVSVMCAASPCGGPQALVLPWRGHSGTQLMSWPPDPRWSVTSHGWGRCGVCGPHSVAWFWRPLGGPLLHRYPSTAN